MDRVFQPDSQAFQDKRKIFLRWILGSLLLLALTWGGTLLKLGQDVAQMRQQAMRTAAARARIYAEQVLRTVKEIDQISLTVKYQWERMGFALDLADQYEKAMHHTPTYPVAIGADGKIVSSWRQASVGLDMSGLDFFAYHRDDPDPSLLINPPSSGVGGMAGKRTLRFTRRVSDRQGRFAGVVMVSTEPRYLASLSDEDELRDGDFISVRLDNGPLLVAKTVNDAEHPGSYYIDIPAFAAREGVRREAGDKFVDGLPRYVGWKKLDGYPLIALATITEGSAVSSYAPTRTAWLAFASVTSVLVLLFAVFGSIAQAHIVERRRKAERVRATFRLAVDGAREAFYIIEPIRDGAGRIVDYRLEDCNERAAEMTGVPRERIIGRTFSAVNPAPVLKELLAFYNTAFERGFLEDEFHVQRGTLHQHGWFHRRAVRSGEGIAVTIRDITDAKLHEQTLERLAVTDTLTGLPNRRWLNDYLPGALVRAHAARRRVALLFIDLDNFKIINDTLGHAAGDDALRAAAACLKGAVRGSDHVARLGGDEFTVLLENLERDADAEAVAAQVVKALASADIFERWHALGVQCSVGVGLYPAHAGDADGLIRCADEAMYEAKRAGKGTFRVYQPPVAA